MPFSPKQLFFRRRLLESLDYRAIDSYRVRVLNPLRAIEELLHVYEGRIKGRYKQHEYLLHCLEETRYLLKPDDTLRYSSFTKSFFLSLLGKVDDKNYKQEWPTVKTAIRSLVNSNQAYAASVLEKLELELKTPDEDDPFKHQFRQIERLTLVLATELLYRGYSKYHAYQTIGRLLKPTKEFQESFVAFKEFTLSDTTSYTVMFKVYAPRLTIEDWPETPSWKVTTDPIAEDGMRERARSWLAKRDNYFFLVTHQVAMDHRAAVAKSLTSIAELLDLIRLAHRETHVDMQFHALVYPDQQPQFAGTPPIRERPDGHLLTSDDLLKKLQSKTTAVLTNPNVESNTKEKIRSAIRYLRFGLESNEIGQQYLNYWIGLEYLFSNFRESTFTRIKSILPDLQTSSYFHRNLLDFHRTLCGVPETNAVQNFDKDDIHSLLDHKCLAGIRDDLYETNPLMAYRAWKMRNRTKDNAREKFGEYLTRHHRNMTWHLSRIYRVRNQIVHEASYQTINPTLTANLRYYLASVLNLSLDYFSRDTLEATNIEELFALLQLRLKSLEAEGYPFDKLISMHNGSVLLN